MNKVNCLIVDDEPIAQDIIKTYCMHLPMLHVVACCNNALEAKAVLYNEKIDILFLDINMPLLSGIALLKTLSKPPQVILTTAYKEYALEAFDLAACDYLLKPFSLERFIIAVDKAIERLTGTGTQQQTEPVYEHFLFIKADGKIYRVQFEDLLFAEANGNYTKINTRQNVLLPAMTFSSLEEQLPSGLFIRVHRSFIVNKAAISHIQGNVAYIGKHEIPIGSNYKEEFLKKLGM